MKLIKQNESVDRAIDRAIERGGVTLRCLSVDRGIFRVNSTTQAGVFYRTKVIINHAGDVEAECSCPCGQFERESVTCLHVVACAGYLIGVLGMRLRAERETMRERELRPMHRPNGLGRTEGGFQI